MKDFDQYDALGLAALYINFLQVYLQLLFDPGLDPADGQV
jgi:hypothetical protein